MSGEKSQGKAGGRGSARLVEAPLLLHSGLLLLLGAGPVVLRWERGGEMGREMKGD